MAVKPEAVELSICFVVFVRFNIMHENTAIPARAIACYIVVEIYAAGIGIEHIVSIFDSGLHMVVCDDDFRVSRDGNRIFQYQPAVH
jgi:hypothetical protein